MGSAIFNIVVGVICIVAALGFGAVLLFTESSELLAIAGGAIAALGIYQLIRHKRGGG